MYISKPTLVIIFTTIVQRQKKANRIDKRYFGDTESVIQYNSIKLNLSLMPDWDRVLRVIWVLYMHEIYVLNDAKCADVQMFEQFCISFVNWFVNEFHKYI